MIFLYIILALVLAIYVYLTWNFDYFSKRGIIAMKPKVLFGNLPNIILRKENMTYDFQRIYDEYKGKAPFLGIFQIRSPRLLALEPEIIKNVLIRSFKNFHDSEFSDFIDVDLDPLFAKNPFFLKGEEWKDKRAEITPAFTSNRLKALYPLIEEVQLRMVNYVNEKIANNRNEPFDARELSAKFTTDVVSSSIFGIDAQSFTEDKPEIREMGRKLMNPGGTFVFKMLLVSSLPILKSFIKLKFISDEIHQFFVNLMKQTLKYREENKIQREDFLDHVIQLRNKKGLSEIDMASHTISFFTDGFETSSVAISHALYELANNKNAQNKLRDEINKCADKDGKINYESLNDLPYLDQVWHESLRLHPPATFTSRKCTEATTLEFDGHKINVEKDLNIYIPIQQLHYDPEYYPDPEKFYPERFDAENGGIKSFRDKCVLLPFGDGPRMCLGMRFANLQSKAGIAAIVKNFQLSVNNKTAKKLIIGPSEFLNIKIGGLWLNVSPIKST